MSTASTNMLESHPPALAKNIFRRLLWKEYRMLRGFWLAVAVLGVLMQMALVQMMFKATGIPGSMLLVAWGAAALYAIGAAVTLFSAESEEQTRDFLLNLPGRWVPMFAAKVAFALASAFCLGLTLCATGGWVNGGTWATATEFQNAAAVGGVAVLEAAAWGLLFSLWMKQPLLAAVMAIAAASFGAQLAIAATSTAQFAFTINSYREAVPMRLLLTLAVFATNIRLGARWFQVTPARRTKQKYLAANQDATVDGAATTIAVPKGQRRRSMVRLLWQTCRESWKTMLAVIPIALFLMASASLPLALFHNSSRYADLPIPMLVLLFLPALLGALVFRADQRGDHRQFLVAHAARPRYVWLARHLFWGTSLLAITFVVCIVGLVLVLWVGGPIQQILWNVFGVGSPNGFYSLQLSNGSSQFVSRLVFLTSLASQLTYFSLTSFFTAYALGQFCSLMLRREILAGLLALILSVVLVAWVAVIGLWQLSSWWFVLPIGAGAMLATWLRMPGWIVANNRPRAWVLPIAAIGVPLVLVATTLPSARLAQLKKEPGDQQFLEQVRAYEADKPAGQATADAYFRLHASFGKIKTDTDQQAAVEQLIELTKRPECRFPETALLGGRPLHTQVSELLQTLFNDANRHQQEGDLDAAIERYLAIVRLKRHWLQGQPSLTVLRKINSYPITLSNPQLLRWAQHPEQTSERLRKAIAELQSYPTSPVDVRNAILADREQIRAVVLGKDSPSFLNEDHPRWSGFLAYLANRLPWEQQRALQALDIRTRQVLEYVTAAVYGENENGFINAATRRQLVGQVHRNQAPMPNPLVYGNNWYAYSHATQRAWQASTSYLVKQEIDKRIDIDYFLLQVIEARTRRIGLITQLALLAYRLDHQRYPESLAELSPKYMYGIYSDPYSDNPLEYRPQGFDLPLMKRPSNYYLYNGAELSQMMIPAHAPLLWSVGFSNCEPREGVLTLNKDGQIAKPSEEGRGEVGMQGSGYGGKIENEEENEELEETVIQVMWLEPNDRNYYSTAPILFTLPKIEP